MSEDALRTKLAWGAAVGGGFSILIGMLFAPLLFSGRILATGDGVLQSLPGYLAPRSNWTPLLCSGFPVGADPQTMMWYPVALVLRTLGASFNLFVIAAFLIAALNLFLFVHRMTRSRRAGVVAALILVLGGFFMGHAGHTNMIHAAAWAPLLLLALEQMRTREGPVPVVLGALAVAMCTLAGHPHLLVKTLTLAGFYALFLAFRAARSWWRYLLSAALSVASGLALAAPLLFPLVELAGRVGRERSFEFFTQGSFPLIQLPTLVFPGLFGGWYSPFNDVPYFGEWFVSDVSCFVGLGAVALALIGWQLARDRFQVYFWSGVAVLALILALGEATPLARVLYALPVYANFRAPSRYLFEFILAISILAGVGVADLHAAPSARRSRAYLRAIAMTATLAALAAVIALVCADAIRSQAVAKGIPELSLTPWANPAIGGPMIVGLLVLGVGWWWSKRPSLLRWALLTAMLIVELSSSGWWWDSRNFPASNEALSMPTQLEGMRRELVESHQRYAVLKGGNQDPEGGLPNQSWIWGLPNAGGYNPLMLDRYAEVLSMKRWGAMAPRVLNPEHRGLDLLAVRFVMVPEEMSYLVEAVQPTTTDHRHGMTWARVPLALKLRGAAAGASGPQVVFDLPAAPATELGVVASILGAPELPDGAPVLEIVAETVAGQRLTMILRAGEHLSEKAWERSDVNRRVGHRKARVFASSRLVRRGEEFTAHDYLARFQAGTRHEIDSLALRALVATGEIEVSRLSLHDETQGADFVVTQAYRSPQRFVLVDTLSRTRMYENRRVGPRAWSVEDLERLSQNQILSAIRTGNLPGGRLFDPLHTALVEDSGAISWGGQGDLPHALESLRPAEVEIVSVDRDELRLRVDADGPACVVVADTFYPGWTATVKGRKWPLFRVNSVLRGVLVPAGACEVVMRFAPPSFRLGWIMALLSATVLAAWWLIAIRTRSL